MAQSHVWRNLLWRVIIDGVVALMPSFLALVVGLIPVLITIAVAKFIVSFLGSIIDMLKL